MCPDQTTERSSRYKLQKGQAATNYGKVKPLQTHPRHRVDFISDELTLTVMLGRFLLLEDELALEGGGRLVAQDGAQLGQRHVLLRSATPGDLPQVTHFDGEGSFMACNQTHVPLIRTRTALVPLKEDGGKISSVKVHGLLKVLVTHLGFV